MPRVFSSVASLKMPNDVAAYAAVHTNTLCLKMPAALLWISGTIEITVGVTVK